MRKGGIPPEVETEMIKTVVKSIPTNTCECQRIKGRPRNKVKSIAV